MHVHRPGVGPVLVKESKKKQKQKRKEKEKQKQMMANKSGGSGSGGGGSGVSGSSTGAGAGAGGWSPRDLFKRIVDAKSNLVVHNGLLDLVSMTTFVTGEYGAVIETVVHNSLLELDSGTTLPIRLIPNSISPIECVCICSVVVLACCPIAHADVCNR